MTVFYVAQRWLILLILVVLPKHSWAEGLSLFTPDRGHNQKHSTPEVIRGQSAPLVKGKRSTKQKNFVLRGTQRIGNKYTAYLEPVGAKGKSDLKIAWHPGQESRVVGHPGYYLTYVTPRRATMRYPGNCLDSSPQNGVVCRSPNIASLALVKRAALAPPKVRRGRGGAHVNSNRNLNKGVKPPVGKDDKTKNPFTEMIKQVKKAASTPHLKNKNPRNKAQVKKPVPLRTIKDDEVPEGMRIIHSPFGDMLKPIDQ